MDPDEEFFSGEEFETPQSSPIKENIFDGKCPAGYWRKCGEGIKESQREALSFPTG